MILNFRSLIGTTRNDDYSIAIQKQYNNNSHVVDFDSNDISEAKEDNSLISVLPKEIIESAKSFSYKDSTLEHEISNLTIQLDSIKMKMMVMMSNRKNQRQKNSFSRKENRRDEE